MGSYSGSSDWDSLPSTGDAQRFSPTAAKPAEADEGLVVDAARATKPLDLVMAFDVTGSMRAYIQNVREKVDYLAQGLFKLMDVRIALIGVGDHCDEPFVLQSHPLTKKIEDIRKAVHDIRSTSGGDYPEAFECLFKHLNEDAKWKYDRPTVLVLITDSVPHGMSGAGDAGCPDGVDARSELDKLMKKLKSFYLVNCGNHEASIRIQKKRRCSNYAWSSRASKSRRHASPTRRSSCWRRAISRSWLASSICSRTTALRC